MDRREFLKTGGLFLVGTPCVYGLMAMAAPRPHEAGATDARRWGMVIDLNRCPADCSACLEACRRENNVAVHGDRRWDIHWIRKVTIRKKHEADAPTRTLPLLCNHCDHPPCAQVCPVQATYKRADGIVIVDHHRCIGCRYCLIACPYNARYFNYRENDEWPNKAYPKRSHGVAESCNFCAHRLDQGRPPACVEACRDSGAGALKVGDLDDPDSEISRLIADNSVKRIREDLGTEPKVYYIGL
ncbi:4Fe-4S dicluster domain-containing protein [bacterium]|nr:4Fe-4S dicluster domain-containing protein [bacterium]MBU1675525.1 4Fe-4S dicluster domain-containing protein [bacterium]